MARIRVLFLLPNAMAARNVLETRILDHLAAAPDLEVRFLSHDPADAARVARVRAAHLSWEAIQRPEAGGPGLASGPPLVAARRLAHRVFQRLTGGVAGFGNLVYRFNEIHQFAGHNQKKALPPERRAREALAGNFCEPALGRPWPRSRALLRLLHAVHHTTWYSEPWVEERIDRFRPRLLVIHHLQNQPIRPYVSAARRRGLPILGIVGSWDQPTTKGPLCPGLTRVLVQSRQMRQDLARFHGLDPARVEVTGWPQMDGYRRPEIFQERGAVLAGLGLPADHRFVLFGLNGARLGPHEPSVAAHLARRIGEGAFGPKLSLLVRCHPNDGQWQNRLAGLHDPPRVVVTPPEPGRLEVLANLLRQAAVVLATSGSILLDAIALDAPTVGLAFAGDLPSTAQRMVERYYEMDHYLPVVASGGARLVKSYPELDQALRAYLDDPARDAPGRARCRDEQLEPFDGRAGERVARLIQDQARRAGEAANA